MLPRHHLSLTFSSFFILDDGRFRSEASELQSRSTLPADQVPDNIRSGKKETLIDLLAPQYGWVGEKIPVKIESLAFGSDLADSRRSLWIVSDNDFVKEKLTLTTVFAFAPDTVMASCVTQNRKR